MKDIPVPFREVIEGRAWVYGDDVNTDVIIPGRRLTYRDPFETARYALEDLDPSFAGRVAVGDVIVASRNFGCGSSREQAPIAIRYAGVSAVVAVSFARIFFRNAMNIGLPAIECPQIAGKVVAGDTIRIDMEAGILQVTHDGETEQLGFEPIPGFLMEMLREGGLVEHLRKKIGTSGNDDP